MRTNKIFFDVKKIFILIFFVPGLHLLYAQPMSGNYTVGGSSPDFATLQGAANSLKLHGVSGRVFFNIRPGTYFRESSPGPVLVIDTAIAGLSSTNMVTFQPVSYTHLTLPTTPYV